ncbi:MAG: hypothetical protein K9W42_00115 [Candidatus Heimdallarchaeota archaeon]|nr:hypothetical protein [Candidatus Heimdallarchaeota archaeon]
MKKREIICVLLIAGIMGLTLIPAEALFKRKTTATIMEANTATESFAANDVETGNQTIVVEWPIPTHFGVGHFGTGGVVQMNFTVLAYSNTSVIVDSISSGLWTPAPPKNDTFAIGESFSETYTLINLGGQEAVGFTLVFYAAEEGGNATVFNSYRIIAVGTLGGPGFGFLLTTGVLIVMGAVVLFVSRKKKN